MEILNTLLYWLHFMAMFLGGVAAFGIPLTASRIAGADPAARPALGQLAQLFSKVGSAGIGLLILTGVIMIFTRIGGFEGQSPWFYAKLVLVAVLVCVVIVSKKLAAKAMQGDMAAAKMGKMLSKISILLLAAVVFSAVKAFG